MTRSGRTPPTDDSAASDDTFRQLAESIDAVFWMTTPDKDQMLYVSPAFERIWGRTCAALYERPRLWLEAIHPEDRERILAAALSQQAPGRYAEEYRIVDGQGRTRWIRDRAFPIRDAAGRVVRIAGVAEDITPYREAVEAARQGEAAVRVLHEQLEARVERRTEELRTANEALALGERTLRQVIDLVPHFVFAKDLEGRFLFVNQAVAEAYGSSVEALRGKTDADYARSDEEVARFRADDLEVIQGGKPKVILDEPITDAQGRVRHLRTVKIPFTYSGTSSPAVLGVAIDVTEQLRLEAQLLQAQKMEGLGRLAGGVAHDFNNLLTVILGYAQMILAAPSPQEAHQHAERIRDAAGRASALTGRLLTFARGHAADPRVIDANALVREIEHLLRRVVGESVTLEVYLAPGVLAAKVDTSQMEQVLVNLVVNARDAMPHGGTIGIVTRQLDGPEARRKGGPFAPDRPCVELEVSDTGTGMAPATMARLFEPFFTTKTGGQGTGLGLATCYGIVRRAGGHIWAESAPGVGSTFRILLPRAEGAPSARAASGGGEPSPSRGETVLVVEDNPAVRDVTVAALEHHGYRVLKAAGAAEALQVARRHPDALDLILTDVIMPETSGPELVKELLREHPKTRVLYVSGYSPDALREEIGQSEHTLLLKPFSPVSLALKVREVLDRAGPNGASPSAGI